MRIGNREFDKEKTYVMGILNVTPDSFSDGGSYADVDAALRRTEQMLAEGADIIDIGGESTRPGYTQISDEEEIARVLPVIEAVKARFDVPVSLDTYKSAVALAGLAAGVDLINDIWGLKYDAQMRNATEYADVRDMDTGKTVIQNYAVQMQDMTAGADGNAIKDNVIRMADVIAKSGAACCLMHNRTRAEYADFLTEWRDDLRESLMLAEQAGISKDKIILDPGIGFAKSYEQNLAAIRHIDLLKELGCPLLLGTSRKSVIGQTLNVPVEERVIGTAVTTVFAVLHHCMFVRVHDVKENVQAIRMAEAILREQ